MKTTAESSIYIKRHDWFEKLACSTICYLEASGSYCNLHTTEHKKITVSQPLGDIARFLPHDVFVRIHRSYIVNVNHVDRYGDNSFLIDGEKIPIGRIYKKEVLARFNIAMK